MFKVSQKGWLMVHSYDKVSSLSFPLHYPCFPGFTGIMKNIQGSKGKGTTGAAWESAVLIFNRQFYLKHLLLKQLGTWKPEPSNAAQHPPGRSVPGCWHSTVSIQGESLWEVKASSVLSMQLGSCCSGRSWWYSGWLDHTFLSMASKSWPKKKRLLQCSQAVSQWRGQNNQSSACLSRDSWSPNNMIVKTLEISSFCHTPENSFGYLATEVRRAWTLCR